jgi:ABC-2 type transport system permease protein
VNGLSAYLGLEIRRTLRSVPYLLFTVGFPLMFYLLFSGMFGRFGAPGGVSYNAYLMVSMVAYGALGAAINANAVRLSTERASGFVRQLRVTPLAPAAYIGAKALMAVLVCVPSFVVVGIAAHLVHGVDLAWSQWLELAGCVLLGSIPFAVLGVLLGYAFDASAGQAGTQVVYFGLSLLGGLWIPVAQMPHALGVIAHWLPSYYFGDLGWRVIARQAIPAADILILAAYTLGLLVLAAWRYRTAEAREYV